MKLAHFLRYQNSYPDVFITLGDDYVDQKIKSRFGKRSGIVIGRLRNDRHFVGQRIQERAARRGQRDTR